jgi:ferredoxin
MKVAIDEITCQGHGRCYEIAPEVFTDDERGHGWVIEPDVPDARGEETRAAVTACPERAISLTD